MKVTIAIHPSENEEEKVVNWAELKGFAVRYSDGRDENGRHWVTLTGEADEDQLGKIIDLLKVPG